MIPTLNIILIQNAFFAWLFESGPAVALGVLFAWAILRYEMKFVRIESDLDKLKSDLDGVKSDQKDMKDEMKETRKDLDVVKNDVKDLKISVADLDKRMGRVEGQLEVVIDLLKERKSAA